MTVRNSSRPIARSFGRDAEINCSKDFTLRLRLWSTAKWGASNIGFWSQ
jgi:hypothetical protein